MMEDKTNTEPRWIAGIKPPSEMLTMSMAEIYERECREQPQRLAEVLQAYGHEESILGELKKVREIAASPGPVLFVGMGASYCASIAGAVWLQACGRSSFFVDAGEWLHYGPAVWRQGSASILTTASGESAELVQLCRRNSGALALVCNNEKSPCWAATQVRLPMLAGPEYGNATKTYTNATAACIVIASQLAGRAWQKDSERVLEVYAGALEKAFNLRDELERFCRGAANIEVIGRGPGYGSAIMSALCIREMAGIRAAAHTGAGFRHGPLLDVNETHVAIILAVGRAAELGVILAQDCNARGGKVILVGTEERAASERLLPVKVDAVPEPWEAITTVAVSQALTLGLIERYGAKLKPRFEYGTMQE